MNTAQPLELVPYFHPYDKSKHSSIFNFQDKRKKRKLVRLAETADLYPPASDIQSGGSVINRRGSTGWESLDGTPLNIDSCLLVIIKDIY